MQLNRNMIMVLIQVCGNRLPSFLYTYLPIYSSLPCSGLTYLTHLLCKSFFFFLKGSSLKSYKNKNKSSEMNKLRKKKRNDIEDKIITTQLFAYAVLFYPCETSIGLLHKYCVQLLQNCLSTPATGS